MNILHWVKFLIRGLDEEEDKKGLLRRLKNIEDKNEQLLKRTKNKNKNIKEVTDFVKEPLSPEAKNLMEQIKTMQKDVDYKKLKIIGGNKVTYDFSDYKTFKDLFRDLYFKKITIDDAEMKQDEFNSILDALNNYSPKAQKYIEAKNSLLNNAKNFYKGREKIIKGFKDGIFPLKSDDEFEEQQTSKKFNKKEPPIKPTKTDVKELIIKEKTDTDRELL